MPNVTEFVILGLAIGQVVEIWNHGSIFASWRKKLTGHDTWWSTLLSCMFCLSVWVSAILVLVGYCLPVWLDLSASWTQALRAPALIFGATRFAQLVNDVWHDYNRTPKE